MNTDPFGMDNSDYIPDPARDTELLVAAAFDSIAVTARECGIEGDPTPAMRARLTELEADNAQCIVDEPARSNLRMTLAFVVAYRLLQPAIDGPAAFEAVRKAFIEPLGEAVRAGTEAMLDTAEDPFAAMVEVSKSREKYAFGQGFTFEHPADDDHSYHMDVRRCFYHEVLVAHDAAELTPAMCDFDANWIEAIDPQRHGFRFDRATTIGRGGAYCPFHFDRIAQADS